MKIFANISIALLVLQFTSSHVVASEVKSSAGSEATGLASMDDKALFTHIERELANAVLSVKPKSKIEAHQHYLASLNAMHGLIYDTVFAAKSGVKMANDLVLSGTVMHSAVRGGLDLAWYIKAPGLGLALESFSSVVKSTDCNIALLNPSFYPETRESLRWLRQARKDGWKAEDLKARSNKSQLDSAFVAAVLTLQNSTRIDRTRESVFVNGHEWTKDKEIWPTEMCSFGRSLYRAAERAALLHLAVNIQTKWEMVYAAARKEMDFKMTKLPVEPLYVAKFKVSQVTEYGEHIWGHPITDQAVMIINKFAAVLDLILIQSREQALSQGDKQ